ncbi:hypothetical protein AAZX31_05G133400 [Glycine max]
MTLLSSLLQTIPIKLECLTKLILFLSRKGVTYIGFARKGVTHIFSCRDLTCLFLLNFRFSVAPTFHGFQSMIELHLFDIIFDPLLVNLHLSYCSGFEHINVSAPFLQFLQIESDEVIKSIRLKEAQDLILIQLFADGPGDNIDRTWVSDLFEDSPNIERLCLGTSYIKILSAGIYPQVQLKAIKYLKLDGVDFNEARELLFIISLLLGSSSNLETLIIKCNSMAVELQQISKVFDYSNCYFNQLQDVKITVTTSYKPALDLIRFVFARSPTLKILTFRVGHGLNQLDASVLLSISCDLLQMDRASPRAEVRFLYDDLQRPNLF